MEPNKPGIVVDVERLIGRLVLEHEMTKATALAERRAFLAEIERLNGLLQEKNAPQTEVDK